MRPSNLLALSALLLLTSCYQFEVTAQGGFSQLSLDGDLGYINGTGSVAIQQDIQSGFGLGDDQGSPYARLGFDFGTPALAVSGFLFEDEGRGQLTANFGNNLTAGTPVISTFEMASAKVSYTFEIPIGPVSVSPGLAVNFVDVQVSARDAIGIAREEVQLQAPLPMVFLRADVDLSVVRGVIEGGYVKVDVDEVEVEMLDLEAIIELNVFSPLNLFAGYRLIDMTTQGIIDRNNVDIDLGLSGFIIGGGVRF